jgi:chitodextrinase
MRVREIAVAVAFVFLSTTAVQAAERFVSLSGNDANGGTLTAPFRTINKASSVALPGDVISVRGGIYNAAVSIGAKGTSAARITFRAYPGENAILDGTGIGSSTILVNLSGTQYVDFTNFEVRNAPFIGVNARNTKSTRIAGNTIHHSWRNAIYFGSDAMAGTTEALVENNVAYNNVQENTAHALSGGWAGTIVISKTNGGTVRGNRVYNNDGEAIIGLLSENLRIAGNETYDNFSQGVYLDNARFNTVEGNLIYCTGNTRYYRDGFPGQGIAIANEAYSTALPSSDNKILNNIVVGTRWGFYYGNFENGGGLKNTTIANNTFYKTAQEIVRITNDTHANSLVENNIFQQAGGLGPSVLGTGVTFQNNAWYGVTPGAAAGSGDVIGNPMFANAGGFRAADYKIALGSIAQGRALALSLVTTDYFGASRVAPFDIGAHQLGSSAPAADAQAPTAPGNLRPTATTTSIGLAWDAATDNVGVTGYQILRGGVAVGTVASTSFNDATVQPSVLYSYQVVAIDAAGNRSAGSNVLSLAFDSHTADGDTTAPTAPRNLQVTGVTTTTVTLDWLPASDNVAVVEYRILQDGVKVATIKTTGFTVPLLTPGKQYGFTVMAVDAAGNVSLASNAVSTVTLKGKRRAM